MVVFLPLGMELGLGLSALGTNVKQPIHDKNVGSFERYRLTTDVPIPPICGAKFCDDCSINWMGATVGFGIIGGFGRAGFIRSSTLYFSQSSNS